MIETDYTSNVHRYRTADRLVLLDLLQEMDSKHTDFQDTELSLPLT